MYFVDWNPNVSKVSESRSVLLVKKVGRWFATAIKSSSFFHDEARPRPLDVIGEGLLTGGLVAALWFVVLVGTNAVALSSWTGDLWTVVCLVLWLAWSARRLQLRAMSADDRVVFLEMEGLAKVVTRRYESAQSSNEAAIRVFRRRARLAFVCGALLLAIGAFVASGLAGYIGQRPGMSASTQELCRWLASRQEQPSTWVPLFGLGTLCLRLWWILEFRRVRELEHGNARLVELIQQEETFVARMHAMHLLRSVAPEISRTLDAKLRTTEEVESAELPCAEAVVEPADPQLSIPQAVMSLAAKPA